MIAQLLERLSQNPRSVFAERELIRWSEAEFRRLYGAGLLASDPVPDLPATFTIAGRRLLVTDDDGQIEGFDEDDLSAPVVPVELASLRRYSVRVDRLAEALARINSLVNAPRELTDRLWYLGDYLDGQERVSCVLALLFSRGAIGHLLGLDALLPAPAHRVLVVAPGYASSPSERVLLASKHVSVTVVDERGRFERPGGPARSRAAAPPPELTPQEEAEFETAGFKFRERIVLTGQRPGGRRNLVTIGTRDVEITDTPFQLLVRLLIGLYAQSDGFVDRGLMKYGGGLVDEGFYKAEGIEQAWGRLRAVLRPDLDSLIETRDKRTRLSTHRRFIVWDAASFSRHPSSIQELVQRLDYARDRGSH